MEVEEPPVDEAQDEFVSGHEDARLSTEVLSSIAVGTEGTYSYGLIESGPSSLVDYGLHKNSRTIARHENKHGKKRSFEAFRERAPCQLADDIPLYATSPSSDYSGSATGMDALGLHMALFANDYQHFSGVSKGIGYHQSKCSISKIVASAKV
jgi:hypothetical protein